MMHTNLGASGSRSHCSFLPYVSDLAKATEFCRSVYNRAVAEGVRKDRA